MEEFVKIKNDTEYSHEEWQAVGEFGKDKYYITFLIDSNKTYVRASGGNKRKHKEVFEEKDRKSRGGFESLFLWVL